MSTTGLTPTSYAKDFLFPWNLNRTSSGQTSFSLHALLTSQQQQRQAPHSLASCTPNSASEFRTWGAAISMSSMHDMTLDLHPPYFQQKKKGKGERRETKHSLISCQILTDIHGKLKSNHCLPKHSDVQKHCVSMLASSVSPIISGSVSPEALGHITRY
jgi:hypothetical protein